MNIKEGLLYAEDHEWVLVEGDVATIGIAHFAQDQLGDIVYVELPEEDDEFEIEEAFSAVESVKAAADIFMPISGKVVEINEDVMDDPSLLNEAPYENWLIKVEVTKKDELDDLMNSEEYEKFLAEEA